MKKWASTLVVVGTLLGACVANAQPYPADNSGKNVRDRSGDTLTAGDQSNSKGDVKITQTIRKAVTADKSLSTNAHNIKIITVDGAVTLRGPVKNDAEKMKIDAKAKHVRGVRSVDNSLEIANP